MRQTEPVKKAIAVFPGHRHAIGAAGMGDPFDQVQLQFQPRYRTFLGDEDLLKEQTRSQIARFISDLHDVGTRVDRMFFVRRVRSEEILKRQKP